MYKIFVTIILTIIVILFSLQNSDHVPISIFWGKTISIRLIFVIAISITFGYLVRHFVALEAEAKLRKQIRYLLGRTNVKTKTEKEQRLRV